MSDDLSTATERQLEVWAFGRQGVVTDRELAEAALRELARRAERNRADAHGVDAHSADAHGVDGAAPHPVPLTLIEPTTASEPEANGITLPNAIRRHRRRMRATGLVGLTAAVVALLVLGSTFATANDDPLAIFEGAKSDADRTWQDRLERDFVVAITQGPRVIALGGGITVIAFRSAAVADGRSSDFDPYCLVTTDDTAASAARAFGGSCTLPERFATEGLSLPVRPSLAGNGFDTAAWGPTGAPRLDRGVALEAISGTHSVLDWMVYPDVGGVADPLAIAADPDRVVLGPTIVPVNAEDAAGIEAVGAAWAYLQQGESTDAGPVFCAHVDVVDSGPTTSCAPLSSVRREGLRFSVTADGGEWEVQIGADGDGRNDRIVVVD